MMRKNRGIALLIALISLFSGCTQDAVVQEHSEHVELSLSWWGNDTRNEYTIAAVKQFEALHPEIKVNCSYSEWSGYESRIDVQMVSDIESDVMQINFAWLDKYSSDGNGYYDISTLSDYIDLSNFTQDELNYGMQNGKLNAIPIALNTETVYINETVYAEYGLDIPTSWDDFFEAADVMNGEVYPLGMASKSAFLFIIAYAEQVTGKQFFTEDNRLGFSAEDLQIMLEFYAKLIDEKVMPQVEYFDRLDMDHGKCAGTVAWVSDATSHCNTAIENGYTIQVADYTSFDGIESGTGWYAKPATMYAISKNTEHPEEAAMLLDFLLNSKEMTVLQGVEKGIPLSQSARGYLEEENLLEGIQYEASQKLESSSSKLNCMNPNTESSDLLELFQESCNVVLYNKNSASEEAENLYSQITALFASDE